MLNIDESTLLLLWYGILALLSAIVFLGRADRTIRISMIFIFLGYIGNIADIWGHQLDTWLTRVGISILLFRLAQRKRTENII